MILVSACLLGLPVRYDGRGKLLVNDHLARWQREGRIVGFCPEVSAGMPVPRAPAEIDAGQDGEAVLSGRARVMDRTGVDVSEDFIAAARNTLAFAHRHDCRHALLIDGSPSCGSISIYDGSFQAARHPGHGVTTALLRRHGIHVFAPDQVDVLAAMVDEA